MYMLDIDEIRDIANDVISSSSGANEFDLLKNKIHERFQVSIPEGLKNAAIEKFGDVASAPILYENLTNSILRKKVEDGETSIIIKNPRALYRIGILGFLEPINLNLTIDGNVGNFFGAFCNFYGTWTVKGHAENGLADKGYAGKFVIDGLATELVGQNNQSTNHSHGVDILVRKGCMERAMAQARGGNLVTFGAGFNSGIYMSDGVLMNLGEPGELFGSGMVGGTIYTKQGTTTGKGATIKKLDENDYEKIKNILRIFERDLDIVNLDAFSKTNSKLDITNVKHEVIDFREFEKIVADENTIH
jgi:glutamate synthase domain-containing protein 3